MNLNVTPKEQILQELTEVDRFLNITIDEQMHIAAQRGNILSGYIARTGKLLADAKYWLDEAKSREVMNILRDTAKEAGATAKATNALVDSSCREEQYLVNWCDRCNRTATHQLSWCVTIISKAKEEMKLGIYIPQT